MPVGADPAHRASTIEGQIARVADIIAYVNHDIDDAVRAGLLREEDLPKERVTVLGRSSSERIGRMVTDVVHQTLDAGMTDIRMSEPMLDATVGLRSFLFESVYENDVERTLEERIDVHLQRELDRFAGRPGRRDDDHPTVRVVGPAVRLRVRRKDVIA